jgi:predicted ArsR family transcriptional regulator
MREPSGERGRDGTRERIIRLLLSRRLTIDALAKEIGVTRNAIRAQIALLRREGLVEPRGSVRGSRRPSVLYGLPPGGEVELSRAYPMVVSGLVAVLSRDLAPRAFDRVMRKMGSQLALAAPRASGSTAHRVAEAAAFLRQLGSEAQVSRTAGAWVIRTDGCPISAAVTADDRVCIAMASMLQELTGLRVGECCAHDERPRCRFQLRERASATRDPGAGSRADAADAALR